MKTKLLFTLILASFLIITGCSSNDSVEESESASKSSKSGGSSEIHREYPQEQREVMKTFGEIGAIITAGAGMGADSEYMDKLISYHAYGDKFTEFNNKQLYDSAGNEFNERNTFGVLVAEEGVKKFAALPGTMKVAVYFGNVANVTFVSDFELQFNGAGSPVPVKNQITLLFVKIDSSWKMVHEHHSLAESPYIANSTKSRSTYASNPSLFKSSSNLTESETTELYQKEIDEVLATFSEIGGIITAGAGSGYDSEEMDQLISYHAYGPKFTEFNHGLLFDGAGNEHNERQTFGVDITKVDDFAAIPGTMKIAVYGGNVANVTFISDFDLVHKEYGPITINNLITLLFIKIKGEWKMVHEHHSPAN